MALTWPEKPTLIGTRITRLDGLAKASGKAKYPSDMLPEGTLFAVMLYSPHAHAKIKKLDISAAQSMPGVKGVVAIAQEGATLRYHGDDIAAVAAATEEQARDAVRAIKVEYEVLPHVVTEAQAMAPGAPEIVKGGNVRKGRSQDNGKTGEAFAKAEVVVEGKYSLPVITHVCLEPHGLTARWEAADKLTVWSSTQAVQVVAQELADSFQIPVANITVLTEVMGGGFGSKFGADVWGRTAAELAKSTGKPVKLFLDRVQEHLAAGNRPSAAGTIKLGSTKDGKLVGLIADTHGTGGSRGGSNFPLPYVYDVPASSRVHSEVFVNGGGARAMRAPGHPQGCALMEAAMDDLAEKLGVDPIEFRLKNLKPDDFHTPIYEAEVKIGADLIGWREKRKPRGQNGDGPIRRGFGLALHQWGGGGTLDKKVSCTISADGTVELKSATQDIGTAARTVLAIIAAEVLGLKPTDVISNIGNSTFPPGQASGGSTTTPSMAPPCLDAATKARDALFAKIAPALGATPSDLSLQGGKLLIQGKPSISWKEACRKLGTASVSETGSAVEGLASTGVGGCQFAEVTVDVETGVVRVKKIVAVQDSGLIIDRLTWDSQVYGGVIMGLNYGLFEERIMDPGTGVMLNPDMELYKLAGASDIPEIVIHAYEPDEQKARGVIGIGEPPTIATAAAIGNAVSNAIGVRVSEWPMTPRNVLNALAAASKEGKA
ncbi:MAG: xanthine dehydrogenase family protein molybdopterin-binding subunit [Paludisphaera borealis]|uniref:xanthine dehydrogenase family protein molybdopterin-binding subunit n=1 Tax=Paludisphaera borealis TaxID=1387353 RepID=UPI00283F6988|nr:xanthine dehydrogenase family protein molybdopterin-binding subunit [Paludisphaera borealis]MDR3618865.1 xanthine dehydrogenase family protein molybdopterin-binding subunit [Paludisphaera borealis]